MFAETGDQETFSKKIGYQYSHGTAVCLGGIYTLPAGVGMRAVKMGTEGDAAKRGSAGV